MEAYEDGELEDKLFAYEERFSQNDNAGDLDAESQISFAEGSDDSNVLISAPHTTTLIRENETREAEVYTGSLALLIQAFTGAHVIYNVHEGEDHNYIVGGDYKEKIGDIIKDHNIEIVIDLHGADQRRDFALDIGSNEGETVSDEQLDKLIYILESQGIHDVYENETFSASGEGTITRHTWEHYDTEAMQLEIHRDYRNPRGDLESYAQMLKSLVFFVENAAE
nr:N-formylglutamate amidohydrolase [Natribacillus halophilus]